MATVFQPIRRRWHKLPAAQSNRLKQARFLSRLIMMDWRAKCAPIWPLREEWYRDTPADPWQGNSTQGQAIINHTLMLEKQAMNSPEQLWQKMPDLSIDLQRHFYEFGWLRDVAAVNQKEFASREAQKLFQQWQKAAVRHSSVNLKVSVRAERLAQCFCYHEFLSYNASEALGRQLRQFYYDELVMLADVLRRRGQKVGPNVIKALIYGALLIPSAAFLLEPVMQQLLHLMETRFYEDGSHKTRSPHYQLRDIRSIMEIRATMKKRQFPVPARFDSLLQLRLDALVTMSHRDGKLACFHNSNEQSLVEVTNLWQIWRKPKPLPQKRLEKSGYMHAHQGDASVIFDTFSRPPEHPYHYRGALAFELSYGKSRIFVNCAAYRGLDEGWREVSRKTAAHTTLSFDEYDAWGAPFNTQQTPRASLFEMNEEGVTMAATHHGYGAICGLAHGRRLSLASNGNTIRGQDSLHVLDEARFLAAQTRIERANLRFHLHPAVSVEKISPGKITLKQQDGTLWSFTSKDESLSPAVEESVYLGLTGLPVKTLQIVIGVPFNSALSGRKIQWKLARV